MEQAIYIITLIEGRSITLVLHSHFSDVSYNYDKEANPTSASFTNGIPA